MSLELKKIKKSPNWYVRGTVRGERIFETTGTANRRLAGKFLQKREQEIWQRRVFGSVTFQEAALSYVEAGGERRYLEPLLDHFENVPITAIKQREIDDAAKRIKPHAKASTVNRQIYTPLLAVIHHAADREDCEHIRVHRPKQSKPQTNWLKLDEAGRLIANCNDNLRPLVVFLIYTGCRVSEAIDLNWDNVDLSRRTAFISKSKTDNPRTVHLPAPVIVEFGNLDDTDDRVFVYASRHGMRTAWNTATKNAGLSGIRPHDLRHTYATWMRLYGKLDLKGIMDAGGWESVHSVVRYAHTTPAETAAAADLFPVVKIR